MLLLFLTTLAAWRLGLMVQPHALSWRYPAPRAVAEEDPVDIPSDLRELSGEARQGVRSAVLSGSRGLLIDAAVPTLDPSLKSFDPALLARFAIECARELRSLVSLTGSDSPDGASADVGKS